MNNFILIHCLVHNEKHHSLSSCINNILLISFLLNLGTCLYKHTKKETKMQSFKENLLNNTFIRYMYIGKNQINGQKYIDLYKMLFIYNYRMFTGRL